MSALSSILLSRELGRGSQQPGPDLGSHESLCARLKQSSTLRNSCHPVALTFTAEGERLAACGEDGTVRVHNPDTGQLLSSFDPVGGKAGAHGACSAACSGSLACVRSPSSPAHPMR